MKRIKIEDEIGKTFGKLTIIEDCGYKQNGNGKIYRYVLVQCSCENHTVKEIRYFDLKYGSSKGCGLCKGKHNLANTRIYRIWKAMKNRCYNPQNPEFEFYGGRGIAVCDEWKNDFVKFYDWANENGYDNDMTIDRIDNNEGYKPNNCQFLTRSDNTRKRNLEKDYVGTRTVKCIAPNGETQVINNIRKFAEDNNLDASSISKVCAGKNKIHKGWFFSYIN